MLTGDQSGYLALFSEAEDLTSGNPFGPFGNGRTSVEERLSIAASKYRESRVTDVEFISQYASEGIACDAEVESGEAKIAGCENMDRLSVRVTSVYRL